MGGKQLVACPFLPIAPPPSPVAELQVERAPGGSPPVSTRLLLCRNGLVVLPRVDIERDRAGDRHLGDLVAVPVEQLPDALVAVQRRELAEHGALEREWMPP